MKHLSLEAASKDSSLEDQSLKYGYEILDRTFKERLGAIGNQSDLNEAKNAQIKTLIQHIEIINSPLTETP